MEHETFLATWLVEIDFSPNGLVSKFVFLIVVHLAGENQLCDQHFYPTYKMILVYRRKQKFVCLVKKNLNCS